MSSNENNEAPPNNRMLTDVDQFIAAVDNAIATRVPAAVEAALTSMLDERLAYANQTVANNTNSGASNDSSATGGPQDAAASASPTGSSLPGAPLMGSQCPNCSFLIPAQQGHEDRWYAIIVGRRVGIIKGWARANDLTSGVSGEKKMYCANEDLARRLFHEKQAAGLVRVVSDATPINLIYNHMEGILFS
ncbi:hypothetical protein PQX77_020873 [Marasmius sp. AFHP31]|nr:hypothetical protein PQX77_020873 [Marasmius sp. AFHP31]